MRRETREIFVHQFHLLFFNFDSDYQLNTADVGDTENKPSTAEDTEHCIIAREEDTI